MRRGCLAGFLYICICVENCQELKKIIICKLLLLKRRPNTNASLQGLQHHCIWCLQRACACRCLFSLVDNCLHKECLILGKKACRMWLLCLKALYALTEVSESLLKLLVSAELCSGCIFNNYWCSEHNNRMLWCNKRMYFIFSVEFNFLLFFFLPLSNLFGNSLTLTVY